MHKIIGAILVVVGVFLFIQGHDLSRSLVSHFTFSSRPNKVTYYFLASAICCSVGLVEFFRPEKK